MSIIFVNFIIISNILLCLLYIFTSNLFVLTLDKLFLRLQMLSYHLYHSIFCILSINSELNFNFTIHFIYFIFLRLIFNVLILWKMICFYTEIAKNFDKILYNFFSFCVNICKLASCHLPVSVLY